MKLENVTIRFPSIYEPSSAPVAGATPLYGFAVRKDENEDMDLSWRAPSRHDGRRYANFKSRYAPRVTLVDGDYDKLLRYIDVCRVRNLKPDRLFEGVTAHIVLEVNDEYLNVREIIVETDALNDPYKMGEKP